MGDHVVLDADSFLMKGEVLEFAYRLARQSGEAGAPLRRSPRCRGRRPDARRAAHRGRVTSRGLAAARRGTRMREDVELRDVTAENWQAVADLELDADQQDLVASNAYSLAEARYDPDARPRAVYAGRAARRLSDVRRAGAEG